MGSLGIWTDLCLSFQGWRSSMHPDPKSSWTSSNDSVVSICPHCLTLFLYNAHNVFRPCPSPRQSYTYSWRQPALLQGASTQLGTQFDLKLRKIWQASGCKNTNKCIFPSSLSLSWLQSRIHGHVDEHKRMQKGISGPLSKQPCQIYVWARCFTWIIHIGHQLYEWSVEVYKTFSLWLWCLMWLSDIFWVILSSHCREMHLFVLFLWRSHKDFQFLTKSKSCAAMNCIDMWLSVFLESLYVGIMYN